MTGFYDDNCENGSQYCGSGSASKSKQLAKFIEPDRGNKVCSGIGLSPASLHRMAGRYDNPMPESTTSPLQGLRIWLPVQDQSTSELKFSSCRGTIEA
jgi:hypothetical protein